MNYVPLVRGPPYHVNGKMWPLYQADSSIY